MDLIKKIEREKKSFEELASEGFSPIAGKSNAGVYNFMRKEDIYYGLVYEDIYRVMATDKYLKQNKI